MGDEEQHVVGLTVPADRAAELGRDVAGWLVDRKIVEFNATRSEPYDPGEYRPGGLWRDAVAGSTADDYAGWVDVQVGRRVFGMGEYAGAWACPSCGFRVRTETVEEILTESAKESVLIDAWEDGDEPRRTCEGCGHAAPVGDWPDVSCAVAHLGITFTNWPTLSDEFVAAL